jgi:hypothetical protein
VERRPAIGIGTKQKIVKIEHGFKPDSQSDEIIAAPAYPFTPVEIFADLKRRLETALGQSMSYGELGEIIGQPRSTTHFWCNAYRHPQIVALFLTLERLLPPLREAFIHAYCRHFPSLEETSFASVRSELQQILSAKAGLTIILGGSEKARTFVVTALGQSWCWLQTKHRRPAGVDLHRPVDFVPILGVRYIDGSLPKRRLQEAVNSVWPKVLTAQSPLLVCNGLWDSLPDTREDLLRVAVRKHVVLTMAAVPAGTSWMRGLTGQLCVIEISQGRKPLERFRLKVRQLNAGK